MARIVTFLIYPGFQILDLAGPLAVFEIASRQTQNDEYDFQIVSARAGMITSSSGLSVFSKKAMRSRSDTFIVCGGRGKIDASNSAAVLKIVNWAARNSRRTASVCTGAFILAAAGILNGKKATTHWNSISDFQRLFPKVIADADKIYVKDGRIWTSAGITAGIDMALTLVAEDLGSDVARVVARQLVVYYRRFGGQSQFSTLTDIDPVSDRIRKSLAFAREHLNELLPIERLGKRPVGR